MNKLPWFTHDSDAHEDLWLRNLVRTQGHVAGWMWWCFLELLHRHGKQNKLVIDINEVSRACLSSNSVATRVLTEMASGGKISFKLVGTQLELRIPKMLERQRKMRFKSSSKVPQKFLKKRIYIEGEREVHKEKEKKEEKKVFETFWQAYPESPHKQPRLRQVALRIWHRLRPDSRLSEAILEALDAQKQAPGWQAEEGKYIPTPTKWLKERRWEDKVVSHKREVIKVGNRELVSG